jgi:hypothetical protein
MFELEAWIAASSKSVLVSVWNRRKRYSNEVEEVNAASTMLLKYGRLYTVRSGKV